MMSTPVFSLRWEALLMMMMHVLLTRSVCCCHMCASVFASVFVFVWLGRHEGCVLRASRDYVRVLMDAMNTMDVADVRDVVQSVIQCMLLCCCYHFVLVRHDVACDSVFDSHMPVYDPILHPAKKNDASSLSVPEHFVLGVKLFEIKFHVFENGGDQQCSRACSIGHARAHIRGQRRGRHE